MIKVKALKIRTVWNNWAWSNDPPFKEEFHKKNSLNPWQNKVMSLATRGTNCRESIGLGGVRTYPFLCFHQPVFYQWIGLGAFYAFQGMVSWLCQSEKQKRSAKNCLKWRKKCFKLLQQVLIVWKSIDTHLIGIGCFVLSNRSREKSKRFLQVTSQLLCIKRSQNLVS